MLVLYRVPPPHRLPSIEDTSDTLPTELDKQLWEQQHQQTLQQQEFQRQINMQRQRSSTSTASGSPPAATAELAGPLQDGISTAGGYTGPSGALAGLRAASGSSKGVTEQVSMVGSYPSNGLGLQQGRWQESALYEGTENASFYVGDESSRLDGPRGHNPNIHSTIVSGSSAPLVLG